MGQLEEMSVGLANHYYLAQDHERAFHYFLLGGDRAAHLYESGEAINHYTTAINLSNLCAPEFSALVLLHRCRNLAFDRTGEFKKAHADYTIILALARRVIDQVVKWRANLDLGKLWISRDYGRANMYYKTALELSREMDEPGLLANSLNRMGNWYVNNENPKAAGEHHLEALKICEDKGNKQNLANSLDLLALASILNGNLCPSVR